MPLQLQALQPTHFEQLHPLFDAVCRERRFMAFTQAGPRDDTFAYYRGIVQAGHTHFVALLGERVVGWCDVLPLMGQMRARGRAGHGGGR